MRRKLSILLCALSMFGCKHKPEMRIEVLYVYRYVSTIIPVPCEDFENRFSEVKTLKIANEELVDMIISEMNNLSILESANLINARRKMKIYVDGKLDKEVCFDGLRLIKDGIDYRYRDSKLADIIEGLIDENDEKLARER